MEKSIRKLETEAHRHDRRNETFYSGGEGCELGRVFWLGGNELYAHCRARPHYTPHWPHQHYAAVLVSQGRGFYHGADAQPLPVSPGDLLLMFPGIPFRYQVDRNQHWQETFIAFRGPAFDVLRESGVLQPGRPVWHLSADQDWKGRLRGLWHVDQPGSITQLALIGRLLNFLRRQCRRWRNPIAQC